VSNLLSCPSCAAVVVPEESSGVCPQCHTPLTLSSDPDVTVAGAVATTKTAWLSTLDWSHPDAAGSVWVLVMIVGLALFGVYCARDGQPLFGRLLQAD
jgi:hypothetical protein